MSLPVQGVSLTTLPSALFVVAHGIMVPVVSSESWPYSMTVCTGAHWRDLPFLRGPSPTARMDNATFWRSKDIYAYANDVIAPQVAASIAFTCLAIVLLLAFALWRLIRACCKCTHGPQCDRSTAMPGWRYWLPKALVLLLSVSAMGVLVSGAVVARKHSFATVWPPLVKLNDQFTAASDAMYDLGDALDSVRVRLDGITALINGTDAKGITPVMESVTEYLGQIIADWGIVENTLVRLNTSTSVAQVRFSDATVQLAVSNADIRDLSSGATELSVAASKLSSFSTALGALTSALTPVSTAASLPLNASDVAALELALAGADVAAWLDSLTDMLGALDVWEVAKSTNSFATLANTTLALNATIVALKSVQRRAADNTGIFLEVWAAYGPAFDHLIRLITGVETNALEFDEVTAASAAWLRGLHGNVTKMQGLSQAPLDNVMVLSAEASVGPAAVLASSLVQLQMALNTVPDATLAAAKAAVLGARISLSELQTKKDASAATLTTYKSDPTQTNFVALKSSISGTGNTAELATAAQNAVQAAGSDASLLAVATAASDASLASVASETGSSATAVISAVQNTTSQIAELTPPLVSYISCASGAAAAFDAMDPQKSERLVAFQAVLTAIVAQLTEIPASANAQAMSAERLIYDSAHDVHASVAYQINQFMKGNNDTSVEADKQMYDATVAICCVTIGFVLLLGLSTVMDYGRGIAASIPLLALAAFLLFVLAIVCGIVLAFLQDGCYHLEHLLMINGGVMMEPLLNYFFFGNESTSVKTPLKEANIIDVDEILGGVTKQSTAMVGKLTAGGQVPRPGLLSALNTIQAGVNTSLAKVDVIVDIASVTNIRPKYVAFKSSGCCDMGDYYARQWVLLTAAGWLVMLACCTALYMLSRLDLLSRSGSDSQRLTNSKQPSLRQSKVQPADVDGAAVPRASIAGVDNIALTTRTSVPEASPLAVRPPSTSPQTSRATLPITATVPTPEDDTMEIPAVTIVHPEPSSNPFPRKLPPL